MTLNNLIENKPDIQYLREEILESEKSGTVLLKWKLIVVAALGVAGLKLTLNHDNYSPLSQYLLCLIPFVTLYVDMHCYTFRIRSLVISKYLRSVNNNLLYEHFATVAHNPKLYQDKLKDICINCNKKKSKDNGSSLFLRGILYPNPQNVYCLESWTVNGSTRLLCCLLIFKGGMGKIFDKCDIFLILSGVIGLFTSFLITYIHNGHLNFIGSNEFETLVKTLGKKNICESCSDNPA